MERIINIKFLPVLFSFFIIFVEYIRTMLPSQGFFDHGELQTIIPTLDIAHPSGYPTYTILGYLFVNVFRVGEMAWRANLLSVIYTVVAIIFIYLFLYKLTKNIFASLVSILTLAFTKPIWDHAGKADEHTLNLLFVFMLVYLFSLLSKSWSNRKWFLFCLILGLGLGNHLLLIFAIPGIVIWFLFLIFQRKVKLSNKLFLNGFLGITLGLLVYLLLPLRQMYGNSLIENNLLTWQGFIEYVSGSVFHGQMLQGGLLVILKNAWNGLFLIMNYFPFPVLYLALLGISLGLYFQTLETVILLLIFLLFMIFTTNFPTGDPERYYLEDLSLIAIFSGFGIAYSFKLIAIVARNFKIKSSFILIGFFVIFLMLLTLPYYLYKSNYKLVDKSRDYAAQEYSKNIFNQVLPNSVILSWWSYSTPLWYRQRVLQERQDIKILNKNKWEWKSYVDEFILTRPVYIIENEPMVAVDYKLIPVGSVYQVLP